MSDKKKKNLPVRPDVDRIKVKKGDTLSEIAYKYKTSIKKLKKWNNLRSNIIRIGQKIVIYK